MFEFKPDYEVCKRRHDAWWGRGVVERTLVTMSVARETPLVAPPKAHHASLRERWMDAEYQADHALARCANTLWLGDAMPVAYPNLGPEAFTAWCGAALEFSEGTSWSVPCLASWDEVERFRLDTENVYFRKMVELTEAFLDRGRGRFITGLTDFHPGGDHLAALRDPQNLALDVIEHPDAIKRALALSYPDYRRAYDTFYEMLRAEGLPISTWTPLVVDGRYYVTSNDFSCMISKAQFDDLFLPGIIEECRFLDRTIYHLDGPGALQHLDSLLAIEELGALQWVFGAGNEGFDRWAWVYRRAQQAGKAIQVVLHVDELDAAMAALKPEGAWLCLGGVKTEAEADAVLKRVARWR